MQKLLSALGVVLLIGVSAFASEEVIYQNDFNLPESINGWKQSHWHERGGTQAACVPMKYSKDGGIRNSGCLTFEAKDPACNNLYVLSLDPKKLRGRGVILEGWMKGENLTPPKVDYLGPKLMLAVGTKKEMSHPDQLKEYGTYEWKKFTAFCRVSPNSTITTVNLGIQGCTGKVWIDDVRIYLEPAPINAGEKLRDQLLPNKTPRYRGAMSGDDLSEAAFKELRETWNANLLRFQIAQPRGWDNSTEQGFRRIIAHNLKKLDRTIPLARKYGIKLVLDMHVGPGTKVNGQLSNALSWEPDMQQLLIDVWREIAKKYRGEPVIYGYDLLNEPREENYVYKPNGGLNWNRLADRIARAIREVDQDTPIVIEPPAWGGPGGFVTFLPLNIPKVIYSVHCYNPGTYTHQGVMITRPIGVRYPGMINGRMYDRAELERGFQPVIEFQKKYNVPIYVGEFGVARWAPNGEQWLEDMISIFEKYGWDWTFHAFREWDGWSVEHSSNPKERKWIGDTPRRRVLIKYMKRNSKQEVFPQMPAKKNNALPWEADLTSVTTSGTGLNWRDGVEILTLDHPGVKSSWFSFPLAPNMIQGKKIIVSADIQQKNITKAPNPWEGIKLMLTYVTKDGKKENPQAQTVPGTSDWKTHSFTVDIPFGVRKANLTLGMEGVSGKVRYRRVQIMETFYSSGN